MLRSHTACRVATRLRAFSTVQYPLSGHRQPHQPSRRPFSMLSDATDSRTTEDIHPNHDIYVSTSIDPYFNLSLEDWLFRNAPESKPLLLIYRDSPCAVIGRNQNPWTELNFPALRAANVPFLRRRSGGGTVYHDLGNTNFSIHLPRTSFDRHATGRLVLRAVRSLGIKAHLNDRNDICVGADKMRSAYKIVSQRAYHHGTMLLTTELDALGDFLRPQNRNIKTKGVASVRSPVCNLRKHADAATHVAFTSAVVTEFRSEFGITTEPYLATESAGTTVDYIRRGMEELKTWEWAYGQTPEFTHTLTNRFSWADVFAEVHSKHGVILDVSLVASDSRLSDSSINALNEKCRVLYTGRRYGFPHTDSGPTASLSSSGRSSVEWTQPMREVDEWLARAISVA